MQRRTQNIARETRRSAVILFSSTLAIGAAAAALPLLRKPPRNAKTGCLPGAVSRKTIILVDRTDPWTASTASLLTASLKHIADGVTVEERLQLLTFDGNAAAFPAPLFDKCRPPTSGNVVFETPQRIQKTHADQFAAPLIVAFESLAKPSSSPRSELVQMLAIVAAHARLDAPAEVTTLHVYSDMEENSAAYSFTRRAAQSPELFASHFSSTISDRLKGITLHIHVLPPAGTTSRADPRIERAWRAAFTRHAVTFTWGVL